MMRTIKNRLMEKPYGNAIVICLVLILASGTYHLYTLAKFLEYYKLNIIDGDVLNMYITSVANALFVAITISLSFYLIYLSDKRRKK